MQITSFRVSLVPKQCSGIFNVSNAWTNMWNIARIKMKEEKQRLRGRIPKNDWKRISMLAVWTSQYLKVTGQTWKIQS